MDRHLADKSGRSTLGSLLDVWWFAQWNAIWRLPAERLCAVQAHSAWGRPIEQFMCVICCASRRESRIVLSLFRQTWIKGTVLQSLSSSDAIFSGVRACVCVCVCLVSV
jgi:hypothetical protein